MPLLTDQALPHGNIMIVDDNPANLKLLEDMLRQHGYEIRSFPRGRLALAAADQKPPDLILLDINMPEMNGYEVCERLKSSATFQNSSYSATPPASSGGLRISPARNNSLLIL